MKKAFQFPFTRIGEPDWAAKLRQYLAAGGISCTGERLAAIEQAEASLAAPLPPPIREYYLRFGTTSDADYMYSLKPAAGLVHLGAAGWRFINENFLASEISRMIVFSESPGNDPLCFDAKTGAIYLFSHDPVEKAKVFSDFSQYVLHELLETERLVGDSDLSESAVNQLTDKYLSGEGINYNFRALKL